MVHTTKTSKNMHISGKTYWSSAKSLYHCDIDMIEKLHLRNRPEAQTLNIDH